MAALHRVDASTVGLDFLLQPDRGADPLDQPLAYYRYYYDWVRGDAVDRVIEEAFAYLAEAKPSVLCTASSGAMPAAATSSSTPICGAPLCWTGRP
jgi:hypothetical protein